MSFIVILSLPKIRSRLWNELADNIRAADSVQNFKTAEAIAISKRVYLTILTINICQLTILCAISNINYYYYIICARLFWYTYVSNRTVM